MLCFSFYIYIYIYILSFYEDLKITVICQYEHFRYPKIDDDRSIDQIDLLDLVDAKYLLFNC